MKRFNKGDYVIVDDQTYFDRFFSSKSGSAICIFDHYDEEAKQLHYIIGTDLSHEGLMINSYYDVSAKENIRRARKKEKEILFSLICQIKKRKRKKSL
jgi:hypothetical protein